jgi:hydrogenase maturation protease
VGCEPATLDEGIGLSAPVAAAVDDAVRMVTKLVTEGPDGSPQAPGGIPGTDVNPESTKG